MIERPAALVIGAGPAGLAAAAALGRAGQRPVVVVDRDDAAGGLPRFCHHLGFGWGYSRRLESGPAFAARMIDEAASAGVVVMTRTTATTIEPGPVVHVVGASMGHRSLLPGAVILATGIRETGRGPRLVPGARPEAGLLTTGSLQQLVSRGIPVPWRRLVIVGTEHVSFSAILTARRAGLGTIAMVEPEPSIRSYPPAGLLAKALGIAIHTDARVAEIRGRDAVEAVCLEGPDGETVIGCDAVLFSGGWAPEAALCAPSGIAVDPGSKGPIIDNLLRTGLKGVFAAGNVLRGVATSGVSALEGRLAGESAAAYLAGRMPDWQGGVEITPSEELEYFVPQRLSAMPADSRLAGMRRGCFRVRQDRRGAHLVLLDGEGTLLRLPVRHARSGRSYVADLAGLGSSTNSPMSAITASLV